MTPKQEPQDSPSERSAEEVQNLRASVDTMTISNDQTTSLHDDDRADADAMQSLGNDAKRLIQTIRKLEQLGITATVPSLPKVVVVGDQSAGKSSLIESICDISLPRSEGTCTRCPFQITTSHQTDAWSCEISICQKYKHVTRGSARGSQFKNWTKQDPVTTPFKNITHRPDLNLALRQAQLAVLNPGRPEQEYAALDESDVGSISTKVIFSPNEVHLSIKAPNLPELSLFDLPGTILSLPKPEDMQYAEMVVNLAKSFVNEPQALTVLVCSADQEVHNSIAYKKVDECDAKGRTIGVLTKADLIASDSRYDAFLEMLDGKAFVLGHGWYVTKQLSQRDLDANVLHDEARRREEAFFSQGAWISTMERHSRRFGILNLRKALSERLTESISNALPDIMKQVESKLSEIDERLAALPEVDEMPQMTVSTEIDRLVSSISSQIMPNSHTTSGNFRGSEYEKAFKDLFDALVTARPEITLVSPDYVSPAGLGNASPVWIDSGASNDEETEPLNQTPTKKLKIKDGRAFVSTFSTPQRPTPKRRRATRMNESHKAQRVALEFIKSRYESAPGSDLSIGPSPAVTQDIAIEFRACMRPIVKECLEHIREIFVALLYQCIESSLTRFQQTELFLQTKDIVMRLFENLHTDVKNFVTCHNENALHRPSTYAHGLMEALQRKSRSALRSARVKQRIKEHSEMLESNNGKPMNPAEQLKRATDDDWIMKNLGNDSCEAVIDAIAVPLAHYDIVSLRIVDAVAQSCERQLVLRLASDLTNELRKHLRVHDKEFCAQLLVEDPKRQAERAELEKEKRKLLQALEQLRGLRE